MLPLNIITAAFGNTAGGMQFPQVPPVGTESIMGSATFQAACGLLKKERKNGAASADLLPLRKQIGAPRRSANSV